MGESKELEAVVISLHEYKRKLMQKRNATTQEFKKSDMELNERIAKIKASIERINQLMAELRNNNKEIKE